MSSLSGPVRGGAGHQVVGVFPAGGVLDVRKPPVDMGPVLAVETEGLGVEEVTAAAQVSIGDAIAHDPVSGESV